MTIITDIADTIAIAVLLVGIGERRTVITAVAQAIAVSIFLQGIYNLQTIIADIADPVAVAVSLVGIIHLRTVVAGIAKVVTIGIGLFRVIGLRAVIVPVGITVVVAIIQNHPDDKVAGIGIARSIDRNHPDGGIPDTEKFARRRGRDHRNTGTVVGSGIFQVNKGSIITGIAVNDDIFRANCHRVLMVFNRNIKDTGILVTGGIGGDDLNRGGADGKQAAGIIGCGGYFYPPAIILDHRSKRYLGSTQTRVIGDDNIRRTGQLRGLVVINRDEEAAGVEIAMSILGMAGHFSRTHFEKIT